MPIYPIAMLKRADSAPSELVDQAAHLPIDDLIRACRQETAHYLRGERHDDVFGLELFRRAVSGDDQPGE